MDQQQIQSMFLYHPKRKSRLDWLATSISERLHSSNKNYNIFHNERAIKLAAIIDIDMKPVLLT